MIGRNQFTVEFQIDHLLTMCMIKRLYNIVYILTNETNNRTFEPNTPGTPAFNPPWIIVLFSVFLARPTGYIRIFNGHVRNSGCKTDYQTQFEVNIRIPVLSSRIPWYASIMQHEFD